MNDMLDWWTVPGERWGVRNLDFKVELVHDQESQPHRMPDYSEADITAFEGGDWRFARVRLVPVDRDLNDLVGAQQALTGIEWGDMAGARIDREDVTDAQAVELARYAVQELRRMGMPVDTERDSPLSVQAMAAPF